jgi:hypothetical protein
VREAVTAELKNNYLAEVPLKGHKTLLDVSIAYLKAQVLSPPARAFVDTLTKLRSEDIDPMGIGALMTRILAQRRNAPK